MPNNITNVKEGTSENARAAKGAQNATTEQPKKKSSGDILLE